MWNVAGLLLALAITAIAWRKSLTPGSFYDEGVYGMTPGVHRGYAYVSLAFAVFFTGMLAFKQENAGIAALAGFALVAVLYGASFLRGAESDE